MAALASFSPSPQLTPLTLTTIMMPSAMLLQILCFLLLNRLTRSAPIVISQRDGACPPYIVIETRGTFIPQGDDPTFSNILRTLMSQDAGGEIVDTVYPASGDQNYGRKSSPVNVGKIDPS